MVESSALLKRRSPKGYRGFESPPHRQFFPESNQNNSGPMKLRPCLVACLLQCLFLTACALHEAPSASPSILAQMGQRGVPPGTIRRISAGRVLDYDDILALLSASVSEKAIILYLKSTNAPYSLNTAQKMQLSEAGAGADLMTHLEQALACHESMKSSTRRGAKWDTDPYFHDPLYWGDPPFAYSFPNEWADSNFVFDPL